MEEQTTIQDEIERKFLLRFMPEMKFDDVIYIEQFYVEYEGKPHRVRFSYDCENGETPGKIRSVEFLWKEKVGFGHNKEHHRDISKVVADKLVNKATKSLRKVRHVVKGDFKYEIDFMIDSTIIMMEVEVPVIGIPLDIPKEIKDLILCEVTGDKKFDNHELAVNLNKKYEQSEE